MANMHARTHDEKKIEVKLSFSRVVFFKLDKDLTVSLQNSPAENVARGARTRDI